MRTCRAIHSGIGHFGQSKGHRAYWTIHTGHWICRTWSWYGYWTYWAVHRGTVHVGQSIGPLDMVGQSIGALDILGNSQGHWTCWQINEVSSFKKKKRSRAPWSKVYNELLPSSYDSPAHYSHTHTYMNTYLQHPEYTPGMPVVVMSEWYVFNTWASLKKTLNMFVEPRFPVVANRVNLEYTRLQI